MTGDPLDPHRDAEVLRSGAPLAEAAGAVILLHGRGGSASNILSLSDSFRLPDLAYLAPQARGNTWYPNSFLAPVEQNQPWLSSALRKVYATALLAEQSGIPIGKIAVCGFSQGACLATEFVAGNPQRYAGLIAFTGGLIGPLGADLHRAGDLAGMPVFLGSGDPDPHVPWSRVEESAKVLGAMGAAVDVRRYRGRAHTISFEEMETAKRLLEKAFGEPVA